MQRKVTVKGTTSTVMVSPRLASSSTSSWGVRAPESEEWGVRASEEWEHRPRRRSPWTTAPGFPPFPSRFSPALRELVFRQFDNKFQATRSLSKKKVFLMSLSIFFIRVLSPALVVISSLFLLDPLLPITTLMQRDFPSWDVLQLLLLLRASDEWTLADSWYCSEVAKLIASQANDTINCLEKAMKISHYNYFMIELCYFSLHQWEIKIHMLWGKCFNVLLVMALRSLSTNAR